MKVNIQSVNFNLDQKLINFIQKRMDKLDLFYPKIIKADVFLKIENSSEKENKIFEAKLSIPGESLVAKRKCKSFEESVDTTADILERQLKKKKQKQRQHNQ